MIEGEVHFDAVGAQPPPAEQAAGIVDEHVEARVQGEDGIGEAAHVGLIGEVRRQEGDPRVSRHLADAA